MIKMNDFQSEPKALMEAQLQACQRVLQSGWYILGKELEAFEAKWAGICGLRHAVGVGNGMDALEIGLRLLGIGPGDEVITTPMTAFASTLAVLRVGATPVFADIDPDTALLSLASAEQCLGGKAKAILLVHLYGQIKDMEAWRELCGRKGVHLLEDCAQSHLARWRGKTAGAFGAWGAYSFYPTKNLGGIGDGGMLVSDDPDLAQRARVLRNYGQSQRYHHPEVGMNSRLDEIQAALLSERLKWMSEFTDRRRRIARCYFAGIDNGRVRCLSLPDSEASHVYHLFVVTCEERDRLSDFLKQRGVESLIHYPVPVPKQNPCLGLPADPRGLPEAERHAATCLSLPCHPQMDDMQVEEVIAAVNAFR